MVAPVTQLLVTPMTNDNTQFTQHQGCAKNGNSVRIRLSKADQTELSEIFKTTTSVFCWPRVANPKDLDSNFCEAALTYCSRTHTNNKHVQRIHLVVMLINLFVSTTDSTSSTCNNYQAKLFPLSLPGPPTNSTAWLQIGSRYTFSQLLYKFSTD